MPRPGPREALAAWLGLALIAWPVVPAQSQGVSAPDAAAVAQAYAKGYDDLKGLATPALVAELSDTVEDALVAAGSHVRSTSARHKIRHFEDAAHAATRARVCRGAEPLPDVALKPAAMAGVSAASTSAGVALSAAHSGRMAALLVRLVESAGARRFCAADDIRSLAR